MCLGNRAENSALYINSQLKVQWENARKCAEKYGTGLKSSDPVVETGTCLFEYYGPGKHGRFQPSREDLLIYANFGVPHLEFVCNHEVILFLELLEGHFNVDPSKHTHKHEYNEKISNVTLALRLNFSTHSVEDFSCGAIGNSDKYTLNLHVLDVASASLVPELSNFPEFVSFHDEKNFYTKERKISTLAHYIMKHYLTVYKRGGFHVLHSLPDFDNLAATTAHIDYSIISKRNLSVDNLFSIGLETINAYLRGMWLQSAAYIDEHGVGHDSVSIGKHLLAEHSTHWTRSVEDIHLRLYFGPLQVQALCKREVILFIDLHDFEVHIGGGFSSSPHHALSEWKLAFIVDVTYEEVADIKRLKLDFTTARFCEHLSVIPSGSIDVDLFIRIRETLVKYILEYYFVLLVAYEWHTICEIRPEPLPDTDGEQDDYDEEEWSGCDCVDIDTCHHKDGISWGIWQKQQITHTNMCGFDTITAVTQGSVNLHLRLLYDAARQRHTTLGTKHTWSSAQVEVDTCLADWSYVHKDHGEEVFFCSSFDAPRIQLVCSEGSQKAIYYVFLREGYLRPLGPNKAVQPGAEAHNFSRWRLAFEVDLKLVDATENTISDVILKRLDRHHHSSFKQLVLDFSTARLSLKHSSLPGLLEGTDYRQIRTRREALIHYIVDHYLPTLSRARFHVLYTIPLIDRDGQGNQLHTLTSLKFQILPFCYRTGATYVDGLFGRQSIIYDRNAIVFLGMIDGRPLPSGHLPYGINWICGTKTEHPQGVVINRDTTIVPHFQGVHGGEWILKLTTWGQHEHKKQHACHWKELAPDNDSINFEWKNRDEWRYEHEGDFDGSGLYSVKCLTHNKVSVPTVRRRGATSILLNGRVDLALDFAGGDKEWSASAVVHWSAAIMFHSDAFHGLKISVSPAKIVPEFQTTKIRGELGKSIYEQTFEHLKDQFPSVIEFDHIVDELRETFEGCWTGLHAYSRELDVANPVFNRHGDLLLELGYHVQQVAEVSGTPRPQLATSGQSWIRQVATKAGEYVSSSIPGSVVSTPVKSPRVSLMTGAAKTGVTYAQVTRTVSTTSAGDLSFESNGYAHTASDDEDL